jgi:hypothetical protein
MKEKIAILTNEGALSKDVKNGTLVSLFSMDDNIVTRVEYFKLKDEATEEHFSFIMKLKKVTMIYTDSLSMNLRKLLSNTGIIIKCKEDMAGDKFINQFVFV